MPTIHVQHTVATEMPLTVFNIAPGIDELTDAPKRGRLQQMADIRMTLRFDPDVHVALEKIRSSQESLRLWTEDRVDLGTWGITNLERHSPAQRIYVTLLHEP